MTINITDAKDIDPLNVDWLWVNHIPLGTVTLISGVGGIGKSQIALDWISKLSTGKMNGTPQKSLLFSAEDDPERILIPRLIAARANRTNVTIGSNELELPARS